MTTQSDGLRLQTAARLGALTLANAFIAQAVLADVDRNVRPLRETLGARDPVDALEKHWKYITEEINYVPIFNLAREVIVQLPPREEVYEALRALGSEVLNIVAERAALRHDLMGRIYHRLLLEAKYLGTFYTSVPAATLLLKLALAPETWDCDWSDVEAIRQLRFADLACGTGTLLMAAQQAVTDNYIRGMAAAAKAITEANLRPLHQTMMQEVLHGYDVLFSALHLTASTLAMLAPDIAFSRMHLYCVPFGEQKLGAVALGSIEFLNKNSLPTQLDLMGEVTERDTAQAVSGTGNIASSADVPDLDLCVMNPPFVRSVGGNLLFGSLPQAQREKMQKKLHQMLTRPGGRTVLANSTAGLGSVFVAVGDTHLKPGGTMALVLPLALGFGVAWEKTRELIARNYTVQYLVVSHDPSRWNFSENTSLSEILVVARKKSHGEKIEAAETVAINLWRNSDTPVDALGLAQAIVLADAAPIEATGDVPTKTQPIGVAPLILNGQIRGEMVRMPWADVRTGQWYLCAFAQTELIRVAHGLRRGQARFPAQGLIVDLPLKQLSEVGQLGPDRRDVYDGFSLGATPTSYPAVWGHQSETMTTLEGKPNRYLSPRNKPLAGRPERRVDLLWPRAGRILLAERLRVNTQRVVGVRVPEPVLSNVWWPLRLSTDNEDVEKALALWLNSTLGLTSLLSHRVPTEGSWVQFKKPILEKVRVLDVSQLASEKVRSLAQAYDRMAQISLLPMSMMGEDQTREEIDQALASALDLPPLNSLRLALAREPFVSGRPLYQDGETKVPEATQIVFEW